MTYSKDFKFTIKVKKTGNIIVESIVTFGTKEIPFPEDWKNNEIALHSLLDYRRDFIEEYLDISFEEGSKLSTENIDEIGLLKKFKNKWAKDKEIDGVNDWCGYVNWCDSNGFSEEEIGYDKLIIDYYHFRLNNSIENKK